MAEAEARGRRSASSSGGGDGGGAAREAQGSGGGDEWVSAAEGAGTASAVAGMTDEEIATVIETSRQQGVWSEVPERGLEAGAPLHGDAGVWEQLKLWDPDTFTDMRKGDIKFGRMIAEGGQAQIYHASIYGDDIYVAKVFKMEGFSLAELQRQWPRTKRSLGGVVFGELRKFASSISRATILAKLLPTAVAAVQDNPAALGRAVFSKIGVGWVCQIHCAAFLEDGRFAFVMDRYWGDLRTLIDLRLKNNSEGPPFSPDIARVIMWMIAKGIEDLHDLGVLHRDLKAANVLVFTPKGCDPRYDNFLCNVADYESSKLIVGTRFWRAPEVLEELMKQPCDRKKDIWTKKVDAYSYAMTCYEVLTGQIPFSGYTKSDWKRVIAGERPHLPDYIEPKVQDLVKRCWHKDPFKRPSFKTIVH